MQRGSPDNLTVQIVCIDALAPPPLAEVRDIVAQIARGLQAFHRIKMLHQDLRPANIMIDSVGTVKTIDFGAVLERAVHPHPLKRQEALS